jgi:rubrerythrin
MGLPSPKSETDVILLAIAKEKASFTQFASAAQACTSPKARRLYNQLALNELKHLLTLVSLMDGLADNCLGQLDLTFPGGESHGPLTQSEDTLLRSTMAEEERSQDFFNNISAGVDREELLSLLETLRLEEEGHLARLRSMLYGLEADRPVVDKWLRSIRRSLPATHVQ